MLHPGEAIDVVNLVEDRERQGLTDAGDCLQSLVGVAIVSARLAKDREFEVSDDGVVVVDELEVGGEVRLDGDVIEGLGNALTIGLVAIRLPGEMQLYWWWVFWMWARSCPRCRTKWVRRRKRSRVARISAG